MEKTQLELDGQIGTLKQLKEEYEFTCCIPLTDKGMELLSSKAKELKPQDNGYGFYVESIFNKDEKTYARISLIDPYNRDKFYEGSFEVIWDEIEDSDFINF